MNSLTPGDRVLAFIPPAEALGAGWRRFEPVAVANRSPDTYRDGALVRYGGPEGARVILYVLQSDEGRVRRAWEDASEIYADVLYNLSHSYARRDQLRDISPPPGCAEAKRGEGKTSIDGFEFGVTLCAVDPDVILLTVASGRVNDKVGFAASDSVTVAALEAAGVSTQPIARSRARAPMLLLEGYDIGWRTADQPGPQVELTVAPGAVIELVNVGVADHNFEATELGIDIDMPVGYSGQITIPADAAPGTYEFICNIPGHAAAGMVGTIVIE